MHRTEQQEQLAQLLVVTVRRLCPTHLFVDPSQVPNVDWEAPWRVLVYFAEQRQKFVGGDMKAQIYILARDCMDSILAGGGNLTHAQHCIEKLRAMRP